MCQWVALSRMRKHGQGQAEWMLLATAEEKGVRCMLAFAWKWAFFPWKIHEITRDYRAELTSSGRSHGRPDNVSD